MPWGCGIHTQAGVFWDPIRRVCGDVPWRPHCTGKLGGSQRIEWGCMISVLHARFGHHTHVAAGRARPARAVCLLPLPMALLGASYMIVLMLHLLVMFVAAGQHAPPAAALAGCHAAAQEDRQQPAAQRRCRRTCQSVTQASFTTACAASGSFLVIESCACRARERTDSVSQVCASTDVQASGTRVTISTSSSSCHSWPQHHT